MKLLRRSVMTALTLAVFLCVGNGLAMAGSVQSIDGKYKAYASKWIIGLTGNRVIFHNTKNGTSQETVYESFGRSNGDSKIFVRRKSGHVITIYSKEHAKKYGFDGRMIWNGFAYNLTRMPE